MKKIIIDTDPGQDDALALLLALASPEDLEVLGIVAVAGNVPLQHTLNNALRLVELSGRTDVPVFAGAERPMRQVLVTAEHVHGATGLDGVDLPSPKIKVQDKPGIEFIVDTIRAHPAGDITIVTLGPLTDIALAFRAAPDIIPRVGQIVAMLGSWKELGNVTPTAEFNAYVDPDATDIVLNSGVDIVMLPLDATHQVISTQARIGVLKAMDNRSGPQAAIMLKASEAFDITKFGGDGAPLHDPCTIAWLIRPELFSGKRVNVAVETRGELTLGMTVVDWYSATERKPNVLFMNRADGDGFYTLLFERLRRLP